MAVCISGLEDLQDSVDELVGIFSDRTEYSTDILFKIIADYSFDSPNSVIQVARPVLCTQPSYDTYDLGSIEMKLDTYICKNQRLCCGHSCMTQINNNAIIVSTVNAFRENEERLKNLNYTIDKFKSLGEDVPLPKLSFYLEPSVDYTTSNTFKGTCERGTLDLLFCPIKLNVCTEKMYSHPWEIDFEDLVIDQDSFNRFKELLQMYSMSGG